MQGDHKFMDPKFPSCASEGLDSISDKTKLSEKFHGLNAGGRFIPFLIVFSFFTGCYLPGTDVISIALRSPESEASAVRSPKEQVAARMVASLGTDAITVPESLLSSVPKPRLLPPLPLEQTPEVKKQVTRYKTKYRRYLVEGHSRRRKYHRMVKEVFKNQGIPSELINVALVESCYKTKARSHAGAVGMWQFIRSTARMYGLKVKGNVDHRKDPVLSTIAASRLLSDLYKQFGDWKLALAAYNAGPGRVRGAMRRARSDNFWVLSRKRLLPRETREYVAKIIAAATIDADPVKHGFVELASLA